MIAAKPITVPGHRLIDPLQQGELDGFCGLYAIINAFRLVNAETQPLKSQDVDRLFAAGIGRLEHKGLLRSTTTTGMKWKQQVGLANHLTKFMTDELNRPVLIKRLDAPLKIWATSMETAIANGGPICASFSGALNHFTVISGVSKTRFLLFDSASLSWVHRANCQPSGNRKPARHKIKRNALFIVGISR